MTRSAQQKMTMGDLFSGTVVAMEGRFSARSLPMRDLSLVMALAMMSPLPPLWKRKMTIGLKSLCPRLKASSSFQMTLVRAHERAAQICSVYLPFLILLMHS